MPAAAKPQRATERVVVLLKPNEKRRLEKVAKAQQVPLAEILRRSFDAYNPSASKTEQGFSKEEIAEMHLLLDGMLETLQSTHKQLQRNLFNIEKQRRIAL